MSQGLVRQWKTVQGRKERALRAFAVTKDYYTGRKMRHNWGVWLAKANLGYSGSAKPGTEKM